jgi:hypothetical protein
MEKAATPGKWFLSEHDGAIRSDVPDPATAPIGSIIITRHVSDNDFDGPDEQLTLALRNSAPALLDAAERCARYEAALRLCAEEDPPHEVMDDCYCGGCIARAALADGGGER